MVWTMTMTTTTTTRQRRSGASSGGGATLVAVGTLVLMLAVFACLASVATCDHQHVHVHHQHHQQPRSTIKRSNDVHYDGQRVVVPMSRHQRQQAEPNNANNHQHPSLDYYYRRWHDLPHPTTNGGGGGGGGAMARKVFSVRRRSGDVLAGALKRLQIIDQMYTKLGRPRYGKRASSAPWTAPPRMARVPSISQQQEFISKEEASIPFAGAAADDDLDDDDEQQTAAAEDSIEDYAYTDWKPNDGD
ncbi:unnamed protein product [Notodromas monacha]|uniref:Uncharacterized protein n=1 Tax=Notodromas monacha TaxID=399045 RepID=A0A7R9BYP6_9CRUS|nr:unnamed protein product [Notodromas monacha]CAG0922570.1 unnamed protein product [Notodromas monacha]